MAKRSTTFSMRMPEDLNAKIQEYAAANSCTKAEAMSHFARAGIDLEENGPAVAPASQDDSAAALRSIHDKLEALQNLPTIEAEPTAGTAIVPVDIRDKIQAYSADHACSEQEALTYYARIGVQMTSDQHPATVAELAELSRRLDALVQDNQAKTEQMKQMAEVLLTIRDYTKPDELELEGEVADDAEDVEEPELTEEERQAIADEHTRKIVSDIMGEYAAKQREADAQRDAAHEVEMEAIRKQSQPSMLNPWIPVLVAIIASLVIGLVVILTR